jgi:hypothetical protein
MFVGVVVVVMESYDLQSFIGGMSEVQLTLCLST